MLIEPIYDSEDELWFAGTYTGLAFGPYAQRGEFYAWPNPNGTTPDSAQPYTTKQEAESACRELNSMGFESLKILSPDYFAAKLEE